MTQPQHAMERLSGFLINVDRETDERLTISESTHHMERLLDSIPTGIVIIDEKTHDYLRKR